MTANDAALDHLRDLATRTWDADAARTLMAHLAPDTSQLVTRDYLDLRLAAEFGGFRDEVHTELAGLRTEMHTELAALRTEMHTELAALRTEMHDLITTQTRWLVGTMIGSVVAFGSLVTAIG